MSILYLIQAFPYWCKCWWSSFFPLSTHFCYYKQCCNNYPCTHISNTSLRANICPLLFMSEELGEFSQISGLGFSGVRKICFPYRRLIVDSILAERYLIRLTRLRFIVREHWAKFSGIHFFFLSSLLWIPGISSTQFRLFIRSDIHPKNLLLSRQILHFL